jgi:hypothetical protein
MAQQSHSVNVAQPTQPLIRTGRCVTVPAVKANTCHRNFRANLRGKKFRHAGYHVGALPRFLEASCFFDQHPSGCHFGRHFCEMTLDRLVVENRNSKRLSFFREATGTPRPPNSSGMFRLKKPNSFICPTTASGYPRSRADLVLIATLLARRSFRAIYVCARGGGTGTNGQSLTDGLVVDLSRYMNRILEINAVEGYARVESGVVKDQLNQAALPPAVLRACIIDLQSRDYRWNDFYRRQRTRIVRVRQCARLQRPESSALQNLQHTGQRGRIDAGVNDHATILTDNNHHAARSCAFRL